MKLSDKLFKRSGPPNKSFIQEALTKAQKEQEDRPDTNSVQRAASQVQTPDIAKGAPSIAMKNTQPISSNNKDEETPAEQGSDNSEPKAAPMTSIWVKPKMLAKVLYGDRGQEGPRLEDEGSSGGAETNSSTPTIWIKPETLGKLLKTAQLNAPATKTETRRDVAAYATKRPEFVDTTSQQLAARLQTKPPEDVQIKMIPREWFTLACLILVAIALSTYSWSNFFKNRSAAKSDKIPVVTQDTTYGPTLEVDASSNKIEITKEPSGKDQKADTAEPKAEESSQPAAPVARSIGRPHGKPEETPQPNVQRVTPARQTRKERAQTPKPQPAPTQSKEKIETKSAEPVKPAQTVASKPRSTQPEPTKQRPSQTTERAKKTDKTSPQATMLYSKALSHQRRGQLKEAQKLYEEILAIEPTYVFAMNNLSDIHVKEKDYEKARTLLEQAIKLSPNYADAYYNLACVYALQKKTNLSLAKLKRAVELDKELVKWARTDSDLRDLSQNAVFQKIIETNPE